MQMVFLIILLLLAALVEPVEAEVLIVAQIETLAKLATQRLPPEEELLLETAARELEEMARMMEVKDPAEVNLETMGL
jgi:hypothetical protein